MNWGFTIYLVLGVVWATVACVRHGKPRTAQTYNAKDTILGVILDITLVLWAMHWRF